MGFLQLKYEQEIGDLEKSMNELNDEMERRVDEHDRLKLHDIEFVFCIFNTRGFAYRGTGTMMMTIAMMKRRRVRGPRVKKGTSNPTPMLLPSPRRRIWSWRTTKPQTWPRCAKRLSSLTLNCLTVRVFRHPKRF